MRINAQTDGGVSHSGGCSEARDASVVGPVGTLALEHRIWEYAASNLDIDTGLP